jgi:hypothetical protein
VFSLVTFFAPKKVTRAIARKLCCCPPTGVATFMPFYLTV